MAVAKRQEREKPVKMEQKKIHRPEWESQVKKTALLASPVCIGQAQGHGDKCIKRSQDTLLQDWGHWVWQCMQGLFEGARHYLITSTIVWSQIKQQGGNTAPAINIKLDQKFTKHGPALETRPSFPLSQSLPSGSFQSLLSFSIRGQTDWKP